MGICADKTFGYVYSVSEDGKFKLSEINSGSTVCDLQPGRSALKCLMYHPGRAIFIMGDAEGFIYIYT